MACLWNLEFLGYLWTDFDITFSSWFLQYGSTIFLDSQPLRMSSLLKIFGPSLVFMPMAVLWGTIKAAVEAVQV